MDIGHLIQTISIYAIPVLLSITLHEAAHGYAARHFGDNTAFLAGRITLNPFKHIDPVGTVLMPLVLYLATSGAFLFGYAKPVPVRFGNLRHPKQDMVWVALAGPGSNFFQALVWGAVFFLLQAAGVTEPFFIEMAQGGIKVNVLLFVFNLFPLPPLDGGRILVGLLPYKQAVLVSRVEPWGFFIVVALAIAGVVNSLWIQPLGALTLWLINLLLRPLAMLVS